MLFCTTESLLFYNSLFQEVNFVLHKNCGNISNFCFHLLLPAVNSLKWVPVCGGEDKHTCLRTCKVRSHTQTVHVLKLLHLVKNKKKACWTCCIIHCPRAKTQIGFKNKPSRKYICIYILVLTLTLVGSLEIA